MIESNDKTLSYGTIFVNNTKLMQSLPTKINQNIQFVDVNTWKVYEHYVTNKRKILNELGSFDHDFSYIPVTNSSFEERRSNFHGYQIKAMTANFEPYTSADESAAILDIESQTYDVTQLVEGLEIDSLQDMEKYLNFSTTLHKRKDGEWGLTTVLENGTIVANGMVGSLTSGFAEMIVAT